MSRTQLTRLRDKGSTDRAALDALLAEIHIGHVGFVGEDGHPVVLPTAVVRDGERVLLHGSTGSPWLRRLASGVPVSLAVTAHDGLVVARSAFESSIHYRSAVLFGSCTLLADTEAERALDLLTEALLPGRVAEVRRPRAAERAATQILALPIAQWSLKVSAGWPDDPDDDIAGEAWAGVVPLRQHWDAAQAAPDLRPGIDVPASVKKLVSPPN